MENLVLWIHGMLYTIENIEEFNKIYYSHILFSYKKNFIPIKDTDITNDSGWGCMLRCSQMILYQSLIMLLNDDISNIELKDLFADNNDSVFSIHQLCIRKKELNIDFTEWIGPHLACHLLQRVFSNSNYIEQVEIEITQNTIINKNLEIQKPTILFIPIRLGNQCIDEKYYHHIYYLFTFTNFVGFIGGKNRSAYYFIGIDSSLDLYYLDPHITQDLKYDKNVTYTPNQVKKINISGIDTNLSLCFTIKNQTEYQTICDLFEKKIKFPIDVLTTNQFSNIQFNEKDEWLMLE